MNEPQEKNPETASGYVAPKAVVERLSLYLRELQKLEKEGVERTSSTQLGKLLGLSDAQVRKDLANFGTFGQPGIGYRCDDLVLRIKKILGTNRDWVVALVGVGNLGRALLGYGGFQHQGFTVVAAFDQDPQKVGQVIEQVEVRPIERLEHDIRQLGIRMAILAVPRDAAQAIADRLVAAGVVGILNFAPVRLILPPDVRGAGVDLAIEMEQLAFAVAGISRSGCQNRENA
jgi:redox-sensing transcriptional repressor